MMHIILTPNRRLAATLIKQHQQSQLESGKQCWETPKILPLSSWLENLWLEQHKKEFSATLLLTSAQELIVWEEIIRASPASEHLLQISRTAQLAHSAWGLLKQWNVDLNDPELTLTVEGEYFCQWAKKFQQQCKQNQWLDHASLPNQITNLIEPAAIELMGFLEITPQIQRLLAVFKQQGSQISIKELTANNQVNHRLALHDQEEELVTMARWAKATLDNTSLSEKKIACIVPNLNHCRDNVQRIFQQVFANQALFNISAGKKLSAYPVIYTALQLLKLSHTNISLSVLSHLLRSPFLGEAEQESQSRALYDHYLKSLNFSSLKLEQLARYRCSTYCPALAKRITAFLTLQANTNKQQPPSAWALHWQNTLSLFGWPGERSVHSEEYQVIQNAWLPLLNEFAKLDRVAAQLSQQQATHYLFKLAENTIFQPQTPEAPVQVLGTLEAAGLAFDFLWIMGMDDTTWPAAPSPNPFIPLRLQKRLNMPNADANRELIYAKKITEQFINAAHEVIFSHAQNNDKAILRPSALIKSIAATTKNQLTLSDYTANSQLIYQHKDLEMLADHQAPELSADEVLRGGTQIFKLQAACPFKAFAELRMQARHIESPTTGLNPQERGKIIHKILELAWNKIKDSQGLKALAADALTSLIKQCIEQTFDDPHLTQENPRYLAIEKRRLEKIVSQWLLLEKERPDFSVVACEQERDFSLGKINVKMRVDRIDELMQGGQLIIDYKTGKYNDINSWFGERPDEPQLPLYCISAPTQITSITYAELHPDNIQFKGITNTPINIAGIKLLAEIKKSDGRLWDEQVNQWRKVLTQLGNDFYHGIAIVDPKDPVVTCNHCHLHSLCRIHEKTGN